jgi:hypothetical protein
MADCRQFLVYCLGGIALALLPLASKMLFDTASGVASCASQGKYTEFIRDTLSGRALVTSHTLSQIMEVHDRSLKATGGRRLHFGKRKYFIRCSTVFFLMLLMFRHMSQLRTCY